MITISKTGVEQELLAKVEPVVMNLGYSLRDLEVVGSGGARVVRVSIDVAAGQDSNPENGVEKIGIDDCTRVHQMLGPMFDVWDPFAEAYTLEVSSPGESPALRTLDHFSQALGHEVQLTTVEPLPVPPPAKPRRNWTGVLESVVQAEGAVVLVDGANQHTIPLSKIRSAQWVRSWTTKIDSEETPSREKKKTKQKNGKKH